jgi:hypothetical protein
MLMYYKALKTDKKRYFTAAALSAVYATYCKEPVFGVFAVIALSNLLFRYKKESKNERFFYMTLVVNAVIFLLLYYFLSFRHTTSFYGEGRAASIAHAFINSPILIIMFLFAVIRLFYVIIKKEREHLFHDSLLFAGMAYALAFFVLRQLTAYYFYPAIILFLPSLVCWTQHLREKQPGGVFFLCVFFMLFFAYNIKPEINVVRDSFQARREFMPYIEDLFSEYRSGKKFIWYESNSTVMNNVSYKDKQIWKMIIENAFLNYLNRSNGKNFFTTATDINEINLNKNVLFFYPVENDMKQFMEEDLVNTLHDSGFVVYKDIYGILIFRQQRLAQ